MPNYRTTLIAQHFETSPSGLCTSQPESSTTLNHTTTSRRHLKPCTGYLASSQADLGSSSSCLLVHLVINKQAPVYLHNLLTTAASMSGRASNRSASNNNLVKQSTTADSNLVNAPFLSPDPVWNRLPTHLKAITDARVSGANLELSYFPQHILSTH